MTNSMEVETDGRLRVLRLNRPERKNALTGELIRSIAGAMGPAASPKPMALLTQSLPGRRKIVWVCIGRISTWKRGAASSRDVWAIALTGNGDAFCSGLDLAANDSEQDDRADQDNGDAADNFAMVMRVECEKPILAGVNGVAVGMGVSLAIGSTIDEARAKARKMTATLLKGVKCE